MCILVLIPPLFSPGNMKRMVRLRKRQSIHTVSLATESPFSFICNFELLCVQILTSVVNPLFSCWERKECEEISKSSVS